MKQVTKINWITFFLTMLITTGVYAQHDHGSHVGGHTMIENSPPNGGVVKNAGKYKIEMVVDMFLKKDQLRFYIYKGNFKTIVNEGIVGTVAIKNKEGEFITQTLQPKGVDFFIAQLRNTNSFQAIIKLNVKDKIVSTVFSQKGISDGASNSTVYSCSMHPEIESDSPGKCPKCGMTLIQKEGTQRETEGHQHKH